LASRPGRPGHRATDLMQGQAERAASTLAYIRVPMPLHLLLLAGPHFIRPVASPSLHPRALPPVPASPLPSALAPPLPPALTTATMPASLASSSGWTACRPAIPAISPPAVPLLLPWAPTAWLPSLLMPRQLQIPRSCRPCEWDREACGTRCFRLWDGVPKESSKHAAGKLSQVPPAERQFNLMPCPTTRLSLRTRPLQDHDLPGLRCLHHPAPDPN
jgi:hypothetical protein